MELLPKPSEESDSMHLGQAVCGHEVAGRVQEHGGERPEEWRQAVRRPSAEPGEAAARGEGGREGRQTRRREAVKQMYVHNAAVVLVVACGGGSLQFVTRALPLLFSKQFFTFSQLTVQFFFTLSKF